MFCFVRHVDDDVTARALHVANDERYAMMMDVVNDGDVVVCRYHDMVSGELLLDDMR